MKKHVDEFMQALAGGRGELDAWLECNNEAECREAILGAIAEKLAASEAARVAAQTQSEEYKAENVKVLHELERLRGELALARGFGATVKRQAEAIEKCREACNAISYDKHPMDVWTRQSAGRAHAAIVALNEKESQS